MRLMEIIREHWFTVLEELEGNAIRQYAILSHTWRTENVEVTFKDMLKETARH